MSCAPWLVTGKIERFRKAAQIFIKAVTPPQLVTSGLGIRTLHQPANVVLELPRESAGFFARPQSLRRRPAHDGGRGPEISSGVIGFLKPIVRVRRVCRVRAGAEWLPRPVPFHVWHPP